MCELKIPQEIHKKIFELTLALYRVTDFFPKNEALRRQLREKANEIFSGAIEYGYSGASNGEALTLVYKIQSLKGYLLIARNMRFVKSINLSILEREYDFLADFFQKESNLWNDGKKEDFRAKDIKETKPYILKKEDKVNLEIQVKSDDVLIPVKDEYLPQKPEIRLGMSFTPLERSQYPSNVKADIADGSAIHISDKRKIPVLAGLMSDGISVRQNSVGLSHISFDTNERQRVILDLIKKSNQAKVSDFYTIFDGISSKTIQRDLQDLVSKNVLKKEGDRRWTTYSLTE